MLGVSALHRFHGALWCRARALPASLRRVHPGLCVAMRWRTTTASAARVNAPLLRGTVLNSRKLWNQQQLAAAERVPFSTFVSAHYQVDEAEITSYLKRKGCVSRPAGAERLVVKECPFCHPTHGKPDNQWKLYIRRQDGAFYCHRCGAGGSWFDFKKRNGDIHAVAGSRPVAGARDGDRRKGKSAGAQQANSAPTGVRVLEPLKAEQASRALFHDANADALAYLTEKRGLSRDVLQTYGVGCVGASFIDASGEWRKQKCITFPWTVRTSNTAAASPQSSSSGSAGAGGVCSGSCWEAGEVSAFRMKLRGLDHKGNQRLDPAGGGWGFFGWHTVPHDATSLIICEGEFDAMAVHQATGEPAVSLPNGCRSLPVELLPLLERFEEIVLWMDNDTPGQEGAQQFATKLGKNRCVLVQPPSSLVHAPKDANEALKLGLDLRYFLDTAQPIPHEQIVTFRELRAQILSEIESPESVSGTPYQSLPELQRVTRGHRRGEVTLMTGPTGAGKTTMLSQLSLDLCAQGVSTLWGSFEVKNTRLMQKMLHQFAGMGLACGAGDGVPGGLPALMDKQALHEVATCFEDLPLYFLRFHGSTMVDQVIDAMDYAVYVYDVSHIVLDNLQFMLSGQGGRGFERFDAQERALEQLRQFASAKNIHLTLVIHPRKESAEARLSMNSIFGTAKATQEADNVFILQAVPEAAQGSGCNKRSAVDGDGHLLKFLDVKKNRFDGRLASIPLHFDEQRLVYSELNTTKSGGAASSTPSFQTAAPKQPTTQQHPPSPISAGASTAVQPVVDSVYPIGEDVTVVPVLEEDAFSILTK